MHELCTFYSKIHFLEKCIFLVNPIFLLLNFFIVIEGDNTYPDEFVRLKGFNTQTNFLCLTLTYRQRYNNQYKGLYLYT